MSIFQHDGLTLIKGKDNILYLIREKNTDECSLMESNCQNKDKEFEVLIDHQHRITAEQLNRISMRGGVERGERQTEETDKHPGCVYFEYCAWIREPCFEDIDKWFFNDCRMTGKEQELCKQKEKDVAFL